MQQVKTNSLPVFTFYNDTRKGLPHALWVILKRATTRGNAAVLSFILDPVNTRAERTRKGTAVEVEIYGDGSGLEVACMGRLLILGVQAKHRLAHAPG